MPVTQKDNIHDASCGSDSVKCSIDGCRVEHNCLFAPTELLYSFLSGSLKFTRIKFK